MTQQNKFRRPRAIAISRHREDERVLAWLHLLLALMIPLALVILSGCAEGHGVPVDYGPEVETEKVSEGLNDIIRDSDPSQTKLGAFVHFATYQLIGGSYLNVTSDTGHTVIARSAVTPYVTFDIREIQLSYKTGSNPEKLTRDFQLSFRDSTTPQSTPQLTADPSRLSADEFVRAFVQERGHVSISNSKVTYHKLREWETQEAAPVPVQSAPNCLGLPDCKMTYRHLVFDLIYWDDPKGDRLHIELITSPNVPQTIGYNMSRVNNYIPGLVKSCLTQMVPVGTSSKTLLMECQEVVNFRYEANQTSSSLATPIPN